MNNFRRNQFLLTIFILLLVLFLIWLWRFLPFAEIAKLWGQPDINKILLGIIPTAIIGTFIIFRNAIVTVIKKLVSPGGTEADRQRWEKEQKYLQNFIIAYRDNVEPNSPWEVTKYTDLEALHKDQDKRAHIVQPRLRPILGAEDVHVEENLGARVNIQTFLRHERRPIMIKGEPGTGKTLTIRRFAFDQAEEAKNSASGKIKLPIYIPLSRYIGRTSDGKEPEPVIDFIKKYLQEKVPTASVIYDDLQTYLVDGRLLLLFDGLNELLPDEYLDRSKKLEEFIALYPSNKAIFTCRTPRYTKEDNFITVELSDLSNEQIERFIAAYKGEKVAKALYQELATGDDFMLRVFRNPFMLRMLVKRNSDKAPDTPAQLFEEYVQDQLISQGVGAKETSDVLRDMAFAMQKGGQFAGTVAYDWLKTQLPGVLLDEHLIIADQKQLLNYTPGKDVSFYHQILQEYFAATALKEEWQAGKNVSSYFSDYRWQDTIIVCAGLVKDTEKFISSIWSSEQGTSEHLWLALKALGYCGGRVHVSEQYYTTIFQEASWYLSLSNSNTVLSVDTVKALAYIDDDRVAQLMSDTLTSRAGWLRELCIQVLGRSRRPSSQELLRDSVVKLRSFPDLLLVAPYLSRTQWLTMVANSTISFNRVTNLLWLMSRLLWLLAPGVYIGLLLIGSQFFKTDPFVLLGRAVALTILAQLVVNDFRNVIHIVRMRTTLKEKLALFRKLLKQNSFNIILCVAAWFFANESLLLGGVLLYLFNYIFVGALGLSLVLSLFKPQHLMHILYSRASKLMISITALIVAIYASRFFCLLYHAHQDKSILYTPPYQPLLFTFTASFFLHLS